jgi:hypothetical protein
VRIAAPGRIELKADPEVERIAAALIDVMDDYELTKY